LLFAAQVRLPRGTSSAREGTTEILQVIRHASTESLDGGIEIVDCYP